MAWAWAVLLNPTTPPGRRRPPARRATALVATDHRRLPSAAANAISGVAAGQQNRFADTRQPAGEQRALIIADHRGGPPEHAAVRHVWAATWPSVSTVNTRPRRPPAAPPNADGHPSRDQRGGARLAGGVVQSEMTDSVPRVTADLRPPALRRRRATGFSARLSSAFGSSSASTIECAPAG